MDFTFTDREVFWRDRVKNHIDQYIRPRVKDYYAEQATGDRWKVLNVIEEEKKQSTPTKSERMDSAQSPYRKTPTKQMDT